MQSLATCQWVSDHLNILITGPTGVGKTWLACALAHSACRQGYTALYLRLPRLLQDLNIAKGRRALPQTHQHPWPGPNSSSSMTGALGQINHRTTPPTCWKSSKTAMDGPPPSRPVNCRSTNGMPCSATPPSPMPSSTAWCTMLTKSTSRENPCENRKKH